MRQRGVLDAARALRGQPERPQTGRVCSTVVHSSIIYGIVPGRFLLPPQRLQVNGQTLEVLSKDGSLLHGVVESWRDTRASDAVT